MQRARRGVVVAACVVISVAMGSVSCGRHPQESKELEDQYRQILSRLADLEQKIDRMASRPASAARPLGPDPARTYSLPIEGSPAKGPSDAPITIVEFADYQCPFCSQAATLVQQVLEAYPQGVRVVYKQFPLVSIHQQAMPASKAALAAGKQGKFWEMHALLYQNAKQLSPEKYKELAQQLGLDMAKFETDMNSPEVAAQIDLEMKEGRAADVTGTPTIFVNGKRLMNRSLDGFKLVIDPALKG